MDDRLACQGPGWPSAARQLTGPWALRRLSLLGVVVPLLDFLVVGTVAALTPGYDPARQFASQLTVAGRPYAPVVRAWWVAFGCLLTPFSLAVYAGTRPNRFARVTPVLLAVFALLVVVCGIFPCDVGCHGRTWTSRVHITASALSSFALTPCPFFFWLGTRRDERWRRVRRFSLVMQVLGLAALGLLVAVFLGLNPWTGLFERAFWAVYYVWTLVIALKLHALGRPAAG